MFIQKNPNELVGGIKEKPTNSNELYKMSLKAILLSLAPIST